VDVAALLLGQRIEALIGDGKTSVADALESLERESEGASPGDIKSPRDKWANQKWRDPRPMVSKVMAIPESGIW
jgi:hypothetical protein